MDNLDNIIGRINQLRDEISGLKDFYEIARKTTSYQSRKKKFHFDIETTKTVKLFGSVIFADSNFEKRIEIPESLIIEVAAKAKLQLEDKENELKSLVNNVE